jgi:hypothetical protein
MYEAAGNNLRPHVPSIPAFSQVDSAKVSNLELLFRCDNFLCLLLVPPAFPRWLALALAFVLFLNIVLPAFFQSSAASVPLF